MVRLEGDRSPSLEFDALLFNPNPNPNPNLNFSLPPSITLSPTTLLTLSTAFPSAIEPQQLRRGSHAGTC